MNKQIGKSYLEMPMIWKIGGEYLELDTAWISDENESKIYIVTEDGLIRP